MGTHFEIFHHRRHTRDVIGKNSLKKAGFILAGVASLALAGAGVYESITQDGGSENPVAAPTQIFSQETPVTPVAVDLFNGQALPQGMNISIGTPSGASLLPTEGPPAPPTLTTVSIS